MKIDSIIIEPFNIQMLKPFEMFNQKYFVRTGWYVKIKCENLIGHGEIAPLDGYSPDHNLYVKDKIKNIFKNLNGLDLISLKDFIYEKFKNYPSIQFGFETAVYDLLSKKKMIPMSQYLNQKSLKKIFSNSNLNINSDIKQLNDIVKIKITSLELDRYKLFFDKILNKFSNLKFRLDFNEILNLKEAKMWVKELSDYNIQYIEQPLPKEQVLELSDLKNYSKIPIAVDESITCLDSAYRMIENNCADIFIIKPMISGGYLNTKKIVDVAEKNNIKSIITTTLESEIGFLANVHIAAALNIKEYCGFSTWNLFFKNPPSYIVNNNVVISNKPGLGH